MLSLGCPKTLVDSENILGKLDPRKYRIVDSVADCDVALLNTCAFIQDAQQESVDRVLELVELKKEKQIQAVIVMGCLVQRFSQELRKELQEVDAFVGSGEYFKIPEIVARVARGEKAFSVGRPGYLATSAEARIALTPKHYRYLKISEGCDHICTFCAIPSFRGKHRSRALHDVVDEAERLLAEGARELILTGQDTTYFGRDTNGRFLLPRLLKELDQMKGDFWIRLLYAYPSCVTTELMETIRDSRHLCHYLDMPLQHASERILLAMKRGITKRRTRDLIRSFRQRVTDLAIRTTFIVGFPGEAEEDFEELLQFMQEMKFERLGIFKYSQEEGTPAARLADQIPEKIKQERWERAMLLQQSLSKENNQKWLGTTLKVILDEPPAPGHDLWVGRTFMDAPEVDGTVFVKAQKRLHVGSFYHVKMTATKEYDLVGVL